MSIEEFEKVVRLLFIQKKWNNKLLNWFIVETTSLWKSKYVTVIRCMNKKVFSGIGSNYEEAFGDCLNKIRIESIE